MFYIWLEVERRAKGEQPKLLKGFLEAIKSGALDNIGEAERVPKTKEANVAAQLQPAEPAT